MILALCWLGFDAIVIGLLYLAVSRADRRNERRTRVYSLDRCRARAEEQSRANQ